MSIAKKRQVRNCSEWTPVGFLSETLARSESLAMGPTFPLAKAGTTASEPALPCEEHICTSRR